MTITVHVSDFKDFEGLQECCNYYSTSIISRSRTRYTFENVNPFEKLSYFEGFYNKAIKMATEHNFNVKKVIYLLDSLNLTGDKLINIMASKLCYHENHVKRQL